jgi:hypothetical protein
MRMDLTSGAYRAEFEITAATWEAKALQSSETCKVWNKTRIADDLSREPRLARKLMRRDGESVKTRRVKSEHSELWARAQAQR